MSVGLLDPGYGAFRFHQASSDQVDEYVRKGGRKRDFFAHRLAYLPKCGPDGFLLACQMCGSRDLDRMWEVVLYADADALDGLPPELFFDRDLIWHQQHFGRPGQIATADLLERGDAIYSMAHLSDVVQRISRRREYKTRVEEQFHGWDHLLLNSILFFALQRGIRYVLTPSADLAIRNTDPARSPSRELFERIYDRHVQRRFRPERRGDWWAIDVRESRGRILDLHQVSEPAREEKTISICHDVERDLGHREEDPRFAAAVRTSALQHLVEMLRVERSAGVHATYHVVGALLPEVRDSIEQDGHSMAFHSFDHRAWRWRLARRALARLRRRARSGGDQLACCRDVDYRIRGYRPPQSRITRDLGEAHLCLHNFEWLASSAASLHLSMPTMQRRVVKIPILFDDYAMYHDGLPYETWERQALAALERAPFVAFSLHDCYGSYWLPHYPRFLEAVRERGTLRTLDEVADEVILRNAWAGPPTALRR